jgi:hypothetical protein
MKTYLLIAGYNYYPARDTGDWVDCYDTEEEAIDKMNAMKNADDKYGPDWYKIVDLKKWMCDDD